MELHIKALTEAGLKAKDIAVIAPYNLQVSDRYCLCVVMQNINTLALMGKKRVIENVTFKCTCASELMMWL